MLFKLALAALLLSTPVAQAADDLTIEQREARIKQLKREQSEGDKKLADKVHEPLALFVNAKSDCKSPHLLEAIKAVRVYEDVADETGGNLRYNSMNASLMLDIADATRQHGCSDWAETLYDHVIQRYTGAAYAGLRDRAMAGLARL